MIVPLLFKVTPLGLSQEVFLKRWFCSFPSSTLRISRVGRINNGYRKKWTNRVKIEGQAKAVSLDPHGVKNAWKCHELWWSFSSGECFLLKKMKKAMPPLAGHYILRLFLSISLKNKRKNEKKNTWARSPLPCPGARINLWGNKRIPKYRVQLRDIYIFREDLPDLPSHLWGDSGSSK